MGRERRYNLVGVETVFGTLIQGSPAAQANPRLMNGIPLGFYSMLQDEMTNGGKFGKYPRVTFLFWNLNQKSIAKMVADLVAEREVDVITLAENEIPIAELITIINEATESTYIPAFSPTEKITVISRLPDGAVAPLRDEGGISIRHVRPPIGHDILLAVAHLPSKLHAKDEDHSFYCARVARLIEETEEQVGHTRTVVTGDLNMNPFETGVAAADALHGVMSRKVAAKQSRTVSGVERKFFYNPMWSRFGEQASAPPGTYYYGASGQLAYFWNIFDQVLIRPDLLDC